MPFKFYLVLAAVLIGLATLWIADTLDRALQAGIGP